MIIDYVLNITDYVLNVIQKKPQPFFQKDTSKDTKYIGKRAHLLLIFICYIYQAGSISLQKIKKVAKREEYVEGFCSYRF